MIEGSVNEYKEAIVNLTVLGPGGDAERVEFLVDTGFNGGLALHSSVAAALGLHRIGISRAVLADGSETICPVCVAVLLWEGTRRPVAVDVVDSTALLGMDALQGHELRIHAVPKGIVQIHRAS